MDRRATLKLAQALIVLGILRRDRSAWGQDAAAAAPSTTVGPSPDALSRWLAGMPPRAPAGPVAEARWAPSGAWSSYAELEDARWRRQSARVAAMRRWAARAIAYVGPDRSLLYPFAGADALHALALFGRVGRVQLVGLEPVGEVPSALAAPSPSYFPRLSEALGELHRLTYFRTRGMSHDFGRADPRDGAPPPPSPAPGVLSALLAIVARIGGRVRAIERRAYPEDVTIAWSGDDGRARELAYARLDLSNDGLSQQASYFAAMRRRLAPHATLLKASSYLAGDPAFTRLREALLEDSDLIVQDDSGLPYRDLAAKWAVVLYGTYQRPDAPFQDRAQADLAAAYAAARTAGQSPELPFGIGYATVAERSNLLVARRVGS